ncbi:hypothetical protein FOXG_21506 [Fusarium oxysporum f. sp. lycopersici 4287]|uniref:Uncharacterized protein n=1 Tax=Fusarium oxysporum f. sp. lycopersici (strain 4287 / CBS 123668 / FGSC 9935 / NRRL 34936) TaxID=426428 RepID=A0A0J9WTD5_FUSO4|nr:hypothetical protein FOXG_21506 [Fusarium oxysporum f. sp. lycopersici 4287]EWZ78057.1 hypothetical protein FOWG_17609 [Fusarium oxysporum f. sp. lycopersici MN25]KNB15842.1 hypothetical protein FOXG_21506 [Fusarium oxysporum f. sp. lycopersici 4287]
MAGGVTLDISTTSAPMYNTQMSLARTPQYSLQVENKLGLGQGWCARMLVISPIPGLEPLSPGPRTPEPVPPAGDGR